MVDVPYRGYPTVSPVGGATPLQQVQTSPEEFGAATGRALSGLGQDLERTSQDAMQHAIRFQEIDNETNAKAADAEFTRALTDLQFNPENGYFTLKGDTPRQSFKATQDAIDALRVQHGSKLTPQARLMFDSVARARSAQAYEGMARYAAGERLKWIDDTQNARIASQTDAMVANYNNDPMWDQGLRTLAAEGEDKGRLNHWSPETTQDYIRTIQGKAWEFRIHRAMQDDLQGAVDLLERNRDVIPGETQVALTRVIMMAKAKAEADAKEALNAAKAEVVGQLKDRTTEIEWNGNSAELDDYMARAKAIFPPDEYDDIKAHIDESFKRYEGGQIAATGTPEQVAQTLAADRPEGKHAALEADTYDHVAAAYAKKQEAQAKDPTAYALTVNKELRDLWEAAGDDPAKIQAAIDATDAFTLKSGGGAVIPKVLPEATAKAIVESVTGSMADKDNPLRTIGLLTSLEHKYGQSWDRVWSELQDQHMPPMGAVMGSMIDRPIFVQNLASALRDGEKALVDNLPAPKNKGEEAYSTIIDRTVSNTLLPLTSTIRDPAVAEGYTQAARLVAMEYIRNGIETDPAMAATRAASEITSKYNYVPVPGSASEIPLTGGYLSTPNKFRVPTGIDPRKAEDGVAGIYKNLDQIPLPDYDRPGAPFLTYGQRHDDLVTALRAHPHVRTLPDDSGIAIMDEQDQPFAVFTWDKVLNADSLGRSGDLAPQGPGRGPTPEAPPPAPGVLEVPGTEGSPEDIHGASGEGSIKGSISEPVPMHGEVHPAGERVAKVSLKNGDVTITTEGGAEGPGMPLDELMTAGTDQQLDVLISRGTPEIATAAKMEKDNRVLLASLGYQRSTPETMSDVPELKLSYRRAAEAPVKPAEVFTSTVDSSGRVRLRYSGHGSLPAGGEDASMATGRVAYRDLTKGGIDPKSQDYRDIEILNRDLEGLYKSFSARERGKRLGGVVDEGVEPDATFVPGAYAPRVLPTMLPMPPKRPGPELPIPPSRPTAPMPPALTKPETEVAEVPMPPSLTKPTPRSMPVTGLKNSDLQGAKEEQTWRSQFADYLEKMDTGQLQRLASIAQGTTQGLVMPVASGRIRDDALGEGEFHAGRTTQADRLHHGTDLEATPGEIVFAPVSGTVTKIANAYGDYPGLKAIELFTPDGKNVRLLYVLPGVTEGQQVYAGVTPLGAAQDVSKKYGKGMKPHVHMEVRLHGKPRSTEGQLVDAWPLLHQGDVAIAMIQAVAAQKLRTQLAGR